MFSIVYEPCELCKLLNYRLTRFTRLTVSICNAQGFAILVARTSITDVLKFVSLIPLTEVVSL